MITLRRTVDFMTVLAAAGLVGGLGAFQLEENRFKEKVVLLTDHVREFEQMIKLRAATKDVELNGRGWPVTIDPGWFKGDPPRNPLVSADRAWVEVAPPEDAFLVDPRVRIALDERYASFWYNPYQGIVRARVPLRINDALTLEVYNLVNGTSLLSIYRTSGEQDQEPRQAPLNPVPAEGATGGNGETGEIGAVKPAETTPPEPTPAEPVPPAPKDETSAEALDPTKAEDPPAEQPPAKPGRKPRLRPTLPKK